MTDSAEFASKYELIPEPEVTGAGWSGADIRVTCQKALEAMEDVPWEEGVAAAATDLTPAAPDAGTIPAITEPVPAAAASPTAEASGITAEASPVNSAAPVD